MLFIRDIRLQLLLSIASRVPLSGEATARHRCQEEESIVLPGLSRIKRPVSVCYAESITSSSRAGSWHSS
jgi:hypothetical protein